MKFDLSFTNKEITPWGGMVFLKQMLDKIGFREQIEKCESLPVSLSNNSYKKEVLLESFITSIWCGANRFLHTEITRADKALGEIFELLRRIKEPLLIAFSTTSSEAVFPKLVEELERFGCNNRIVSFILPLGYSFNLDGSMMYMTFASIFIAQIYGIEMTVGQQITMLLVLMLTSKGIAGVPRASLVIIVATCSMFGIPPEGIALILPIDHFCDMGRSMTNVLGNALATSAVSKWEGQLDDHGGNL